MMDTEYPESRVMTVRLCSKRQRQRQRPTCKRTTARQKWAMWRMARGVWAGGYVRLLTAPNANAKLEKSTTPTYGLSLAPANLSGYNTCPWSTPLCRKGCLNTAGKGTLDRVQRGRKLKTEFLAEDPDTFLWLLEDEIRAAVAKHGRILVRLNVLSDLEWERIAPWLFDIEGVEFYDYTKSLGRVLDSLEAGWPKNYKLVYSVSERDSDADVLALLHLGVKVAIVFESQVPDTWYGLPVTNGDESDDRTAAEHQIIGLKAKGRMRKTADYVGFVRPCKPVLAMA